MTILIAYWKTGLKEMKNECLFNKNVYPKEVIASAIDDYRNISEIELYEEDNNYYKCRFNKCLLAPSIVMNEFNNYLIEILNSKHRRHDIY